MTDIIDRLRTLASSADQLGLADLLSEAADTIEKMRGLGVATVGAGFAEITKDMHHPTPEEQEVFSAALRRSVKMSEP